MKTPTGTSESTPPSAAKKKRVGPIAFLGQVRAEARKVTWTSFPELRAAAIMVVVMVFVAALFFYLTDSVVKLLVGFLTGIWNTGATPNG